MVKQLTGFDSAVSVSTEHPASSYGNPVLLIDDEPYGLNDVTPAGDIVKIMLEDWLCGIPQPNQAEADAVRIMLGAPTTSYTVQAIAV